MAKARIDIPNHLPANVARPLYAGVGATDRVVSVVREAVADVQERARALQKTVSGLDYQPQALREQATHAVAAGADVLGKDAQARRRALEQRVADQVAAAGSTYDDLVKRGEILIGRIRRQPSTAATTSSAKTTAAKAKATRTQAGKTAESARKSTSRTTRKAAKSPARSSAKATSTAARKTASNAAEATTDAAKKVGD